MLVLTRNTHESIQIGDNITVKLVSVNGQQAKIAIEAPDSVQILRSELISDDKAAT